MSLRAILKMLYAPHRAFREIIQNPKYIGPIVIMLLFVAANAASAYTLLSKTYVEQTLPAGTLENKDEWTESISMWRTLVGEPPKENYTDYIEGVLYGNRSIEFSAKNSTEIVIQLDNMGSVNCSSPEGYTKLYFRVKWISPNASPKRAVLYLYSEAPSSYFYYNLTEKFASSTAKIWNNITLNLADEGWVSTEDAYWAKITSLKLELSWLEQSNITVLVDGLFFGGLFKSQLEDASTYLTYSSASAFMQFIIRWVFLGGIIYVMTKAFKAATVWRVMLILVGFALITMFVQTLINAAAFSTLPNLKYPFEYIGGVKGESEIAYSKILEEAWLVDRIYSYVQAAVIIWTIALCAMAVRFATEFSWSKSLLLTVVAYFAATTLESILIGI